MEFPVDIEKIIVCYTEPKYYKYMITVDSKNYNFREYKELGIQYLDLMGEKLEAWFRKKYKKLEPNYKIYKSQILRFGRKKYDDTISKECSITPVQDLYELTIRKISEVLEELEIIRLEKNYLFDVFSGYIDVSILKDFNHFINAKGDISSKTRITSGGGNLIFCPVVFIPKDYKIIEFLHFIIERSFYL